MHCGWVSMFCTWHPRQPWVFACSWSGRALQKRLCPWVFACSWHPRPPHGARLSSPATSSLVVQVSATQCLPRRLSSPRLSSSCAAPLPPPQGGGSPGDSRKDVDVGPLVWLRVGDVEVTGRFMQGHDVSVLHADRKIVGHRVARWDARHAICARAGLDVPARVQAAYRQVHWQYG